MFALQLAVTHSKLVAICFAVWTAFHPVAAKMDHAGEVANAIAWTAATLPLTEVPVLSDDPRDDAREVLAAVMARASNVRRLGAASIDLALTAAGRFDAYWERGLQPWDIAAGIVLLREAGGFVSDLDGGQDMLEKGTICAGTELIQRELLALVRSI
jgi:fructose-1,6-bisphosphatase/inositol monophosphatase family enzyme